MAQRRCRTFSSLSPGQRVQKGVDQRIFPVGLLVTAEIRIVRPETLGIFPESVLSYPDQAGHAGNGRLLWDLWKMVLEKVSVE